MNKNLLAGIGLIATLGIVAVTAFSFGIQSSAHPTTTSSDVATDVAHSEVSKVLTEPETQDDSEPGVELPNEVVQTDTAVEPKAGFISSSTLPPSGPQEGIQVHGHWTIDVKEPDGKLVSHNEFENALQPDGIASLVKFLTREKSVGEWKVSISGTTSPCTAANGFGTPCSIMELPASDPLYAAQPGNTFPGLTATENAAGELVLSGSATVGTDTNITAVTTAINRCSATTAPSATVGCNPNLDIGFLFQFTHKTLDTPVAVLDGQIVTATVTISFS